MNNEGVWGKRKINMYKIKKRASKKVKYKVGT